MYRVLELNSRLDKQTSDKQMVQFIHSTQFILQPTVDYERLLIKRCKLNYVGSAEKITKLWICQGCQQKQTILILNKVNTCPPLYRGAIAYQFALRLLRCGPRFDSGAIHLCKQIALMTCFSNFTGLQGGKRCSDDIADVNNRMSSQIWVTCKAKLM